ncbi:hypothetical protein GE061_008981 [Apolygus lucorum]|uniref:Uncharacterized protein n=1 Tax=Apolygus lucorum TaxID=248454 RepID=A0A8S9Y106_APOLU|nr:hypothetical protein GE061_008981 [Apolygus lucorum]
MENQYVRNVYNTEEQRRFAFSSGNLRHRLVFRNINIPYTNQTAVTDAALPFIFHVYAVGRCLYLQIPVGTNARTIAALEAVAPNLPDDSFCDTANSRELFVHSVICFVRHHDYSNQLTDLGATTMAQVLPLTGLNEATQALFTAGIAAHGLAQDMTIAAYVPNAAAMQNMAQSFCVVLSYLFNHFKTVRGCSLGSNVYALVYIALAKRGTVSDNKLNKIRAEIETETRKVLTITAQEVEVMHREMSPLITGQNARTIMEHLAGEMDAYSLRLRLTVQQAAKGGMTSYWAIHSAITNYPTFNWAEAHRYLARDFLNFERACNLVRGNEYYGFNADLGDAAAPRYKSLSWLAMHLLVRFNAAEHGSLTQYATYNRRPDHADQLQALFFFCNPLLYHDIIIMIQILLNVALAMLVFPVEAPTTNDLPIEGNGDQYQESFLNTTLPQLLTEESDEQPTQPLCWVNNVQEIPIPQLGSQMDADIQYGGPKREKTSSWEEYLEEGGDRTVPPAGVESEGKIRARKTWQIWLNDGIEVQVGVEKPEFTNNFCHDQVMSKRKYGAWGEEDMERALSAYRNQYGIPKPTLKRHLDGTNVHANEGIKKLGRCSTLPAEVEQELVNHLIKMESLLFGLSY